jgi:hypothetical protein
MTNHDNSDLHSKRSTGEFFTSHDLAHYVEINISKFLLPNIIIEPYAGEGALIEPFIEKNIICILNDKNKDNYVTLKKKFNQKNLLIHNLDFITFEKNLLLNKLNSQSNLDINSTLLFYTNPPFGTISTNRLASKKFEKKQAESRKIDIFYSGLESYGKGDLILPAMGKIIEILKHLGQGYLAFFGPLGIFCKRKRYNMLLDSLLKDFEFLWGEIFSGEQFQSVNKKKPIVLTLWRFKKDFNSSLTNIKLNFEDKVISLKPAPLLKEYWRYDTRKFISGDIVVQGNDRFNVMAPKMFHTAIKKGGSELHPDNLIKPLNVQVIPDELAIGLWSVTVGYRSLTNYPLYMDNAYVHLPDFQQPEVHKILLLAILHVILVEKNLNYTNGQIKYNSNENLIQFGNTRLTKGANDLLIKYKGEIILDQSIISIIKNLNEKSFNMESIKNLKREIREEIETLLLKINYWDFIPIPKM